MKKLILCASLVCLGMTYSCTKDELVPADEKPEWLGSSIYEELKGGSNLTGTFNTYLQLVDDLGYDEVLSRTGSKTIFPANDQAFERFFNSDNALGVHSYNDLTTQQKKLLLYSSMLDNAMLTNMLSNVEQDKNNVSRGVAIKHETNLAVSDYITTLYNESQMPKNNPYWEPYYQKGINLVYDGTKTMMVHFTNEQMLLNNITTEGVDCDFGILRGEIKGTPVQASDTTYIFQNKVINQNATCTNGYIHQVENVIVPPGNLAQVLRSEPNTKLFSRILDYHCAPYYDPQTTLNYNSWALQNGEPMIDSIFQVRYFAAKSQNNNANVNDPQGIGIAANKRLPWDPGWNKYYSSSDASKELADMGAILVPTDEAITNYFVNGGGGAYFIDEYGVPGLPNTPENIEANLDALHNNGNGILTSFLTNLMQGSFVNSVPSKFGTITAVGSGDFIGLTKEAIAKKDGKYDVKVANNGVIYKLDRMVAPDEYQSVIGPALVYPNMSVMKYFASDKTEGDRTAIFGADLYYYLMAMKANYAFFIPTNDALTKCFIDPVSLGTGNPRALEFYDHVEQIPNTNRTQVLYGVKFHEFDKTTGTINPAVYQTVENIVKSGTPSTSDYKSQVSDMLNYCTVVLASGEKFGINKYYLTKHGGAIRIDNYHEDPEGGNYTGTVRGGAQIDYSTIPAAQIERGFAENNGVAFRINGVVQPAINSVRNILDNTKKIANPGESRFSKFVEMTGLFDNSDLLDWAGISGKPLVEGSTTSLQTKYIVFSNKGDKALDQNVNFYNGYNYTFFAPNDDAMDIAYSKGLPTNEEIEQMWETYNGLNPGDIDPADPSRQLTEDDIIAVKLKALNMIDCLRSFIRYHFMNNSIFADNYVKETVYQSMYSTKLGIPVNLTIASSNCNMTVKDEAGNTYNIDGSDYNTATLANKMARDYEYDKEKTSATSIAVSSFSVIHEMTKPLCFSKSGRYDDAWATPVAPAKAAKLYQQTINLIKNYKD